MCFRSPEYRQLSWYAPEGDLAQDQRHRVMLWINYEVPWVNRLSLSLLQAFASGLPWMAPAARAGANPNGQIGFSGDCSGRRASLRNQSGICHSAGHTERKLLLHGERRIWVLNGHVAPTLRPTTTFHLDRGSASAQRDSSRCR